MHRIPAARRFSFQKAPRRVPKREASKLEVESVCSFFGSKPPWSTGPSKGERLLPCRALRLPTSSRPPNEHRIGCLMRRSPRLGWRTSTARENSRTCSALSVAQRTETGTVKWTPWNVRLAGVSAREIDARYQSPHPQKKKSSQTNNRPFLARRFVRDLTLDIGAPQRLPLRQSSMSRQPNPSPQRTVRQTDNVAALRSSRPGLCVDSEARIPSV